MKNYVLGCALYNIFDLASNRESHYRELMQEFIFSLFVHANMCVCVYVCERERERERERHIETLLMRLNCYVFIHKIPATF